MVEDFREKLHDLLLAEEQSLQAHDCVSALSIKECIVLTSMPIPTQYIQNIYNRRAKLFANKAHLIDGYDKLLPSLNAILEAKIRFHQIITPEVYFLLFTDEDVANLTGILARRSSEEMLTKAIYF